MDYLDHDGLLAACRALAATFPRWVRLSSLGESRMGRSIPLLTVGDHDGAPGDHPALWLDGGTHAGEWTGVMAALHSATRWATELDAGDPARRAWFAAHTAYVAPCISPDGFDATRRGAPALRSTLRPPRDGRPRVGLDPSDLDGDGRVRWMRWRHPTGPWVFDDPTTARMRHRTVDDPPEAAFHVAPEGLFLAWDGVRWTSAALPHGLDLNRNFPGAWAPFEMFGQDGGDFPLSEPESRTVVDGFRARPRVAAGLTNHTYTGALLTQPYRDPSPLGEADIQLMERLGRDAVRGTGYRVVRTLPDFTYDPKRPIVGVWSDTMSTVFGVPGYTLELWDPFAFAGVANPDPGGFWTRPDPATCAALMDHYAKEPGAVAPWLPFAHPQLGAVEVGGLDLLHTMHNPPARLLEAECDRGFTVADRLLRALPTLHVTATARPVGAGLRLVEVVVENRGMLATSGLAHGQAVGIAPPVVVEAHAPVRDGERTRQLGWIDGWGALQGGTARHPLYPGLPFSGGNRAATTFLVEGGGPVRITWEAGRGGRGEVVTPG